MKRILALFLLVLVTLLPLQVFSQSTPRTEIKEADGTPTVYGVERIVVGNTTLTDDGVVNGKNQVTLTTGGGGGGGSVDSVSATAPITETGTAADPIVGIVAATQSVPGSMSSADKTKLDGIDTAATGARGFYGSFTGGAASTAHAATYILAVGVFTENYDPAGLFTFDGTKMEVCYTGTPDLSGHLTWGHHGNPTESSPQVLTDAIGQSTSPVANGDEIAATVATGQTVSTGIDHYGFGSTPFTFTSASPCAGLLTKSNTSTDPDYVIETGFFAFSDSPTPGGTDLVSTTDLEGLPIFATGASGRQVVAAYYFPGAGTLYFPSDITTNNNGIAHDFAPGPTDFIFGDASQISGASTSGLGLRSGNRHSTMRIYAKTVNDKGGLDIAASATGTSELLRLFSLGYAEPSIVGKTSDDYQSRLYAIGYSGKPVAGFYGDGSNSQGHDLGTLFAMSEPGTGGGMCIASKNTGYGSVSSLIADSTCIALDRGATSAEFVSGTLFMDGNQNGTKDAGESYLGGGSGVPNHMTLYLEAPSNGTIADIDRIRAGFTAGNLYCKTDTGTLSINIQIDDGTPANMLASALACSSTEATTSTFGGAHGGTLSAGSYVDVIITSVSGSPNYLTLTLDE